MATKAFDLAVKVGEYVTKNGDTKAKWQSIGSMMHADDGSPFLLLDRWVNLAGLPVQEGKNNILVSCFEPRQDSDRSGKPARKNRDDAPF